MPARGQTAPFRFSFVGPYSPRPGFKRTFGGACVEAKRIALSAVARGDDDACTVTDRETGQTWIIRHDTDWLALELDLEGSSRPYSTDESMKSACRHCHRYHDGLCD